MEILENLPTEFPPSSDLAAAGQAGDNVGGQTTEVALAAYSAAQEARNSARKSREEIEKVLASAALADPPGGTVRSLSTEDHSIVTLPTPPLTPELPSSSNGNLGHMPGTAPGSAVTPAFLPQDPEASVADPATTNMAAVLDYAEASQMGMGGALDALQKVVSIKGPVAKATGLIGSGGTGGPIAEATEDNDSTVQPLLVPGQDVESHFPSNVAMTPLSIPHQLGKVEPALDIPTPPTGGSSSPFPPPASLRHSHRQSPGPDIVHPRTGDDVAPQSPPKPFPFTKLGSLASAPREGLRFFIKTPFNEVMG